MKNIFPIAIITFSEGMRYKIFYGVFIFALFTMGSSILVSGMFMRDIQKIILDFCLASVNISGLMVPLFLVIHLFSGDMESKTIYTIMARPISRPSYILGKFLGFSMLTFSIMVILTISTLITISIAKTIYSANYFTTYSISSILTSSLFSFLAITLLNACTFLWCSITTSSFLSTMLVMATYVIGHTSEDIVRFIAMDIPGVEITPAIERTAQTALYLFPNLAAFDLKQAAAYGIAISIQEYSLLITYGFSYTCCMLILAILIFNKRDLT